MFRERLRTAVEQVGLALREPEAFALRWHQDGAPYGLGVFAALGITSALGTTLYGLTMGWLGGPGRMFECAWTYTLAAAIAVNLPLPALYILNSFFGSRLRVSTTFLAALVMTSWGGLALIASMPVSLFFAIALPYPEIALGVHLAVFALVGIAASDVFGRTMAALEPDRGRLPGWWLLLVGAIGAELFYAFDLFRFSA